jgi:homocysteine S-methyltransferase
MATLPQLTADDIYLTDGGLETTLVFLEGLDLPDFAAFPLLASGEGKAAIDRYYAAYLDLAERTGAGFVLDTPTWRASRDWGLRLGYDDDALVEVNRRAVDYIKGLADVRPTLTTVLNGVVGPRGDGYVVGDLMTAQEAADYHSLQARAFASAGAQMLTAVTMTYAGEAIGITDAASAEGLPVVISFTVETDGRLPSGQELGAAVTEVDEATDGGPAYFMVNCAHPTHFAGVLEQGGSWVERVKGVRANASTMSHAELNEAEELDRGDVPGLARHYGELRRILPDMRVAGGCCGTDAAHITAIADELSE